MSIWRKRIVGISGLLGLGVWFSPVAAEEVGIEVIKGAAVKDAVERLEEVLSRGLGDSTRAVSMPGAVSLYGVFAETGEPNSYYRLYSSRQPWARRISELEGDVRDDWMMHPYRFVDLNAPIAHLTGTFFPIVDPSLYTGNQQADVGKTPEGFSYVEGVPGVELGKRLPMPVAWAYLLKDGNVVYHNSEGVFVAFELPSESNPIVGRYAFWMDDLSSKINVNTAAEGAYWDTPRVNTIEDRSYAARPPATGEYQRHSGHPAMTSLSSVLHPGKRYYLPETTGNLDALTLEEAREIWKAAPGVSHDGGSLGGTRLIDLDATGSIEPDPSTYELHSSVQAFSALFSGEANRQASLGEFFLTTTSRSSELTWSGVPRMCLWPVHADEDKRSNYDRAVSDLFTVGESQFFYQRRNPASANEDPFETNRGRNENLFKFYQDLSDLAVPGYGDNYGTKYGRGRFDDRFRVFSALFDHIRTTNPFEFSNRGQITGTSELSRLSPHLFNERILLPLALGRAFTLSEIALIITVRAEVTAEGERRGAASDIERFQLEPGQQLVEAGLLLEMFAPVQSLAGIVPRMTATYGGGDGSGSQMPENLFLDGQRLTWPREQAPFVQTSDTLPSGLDPRQPHGGVRLFEDILTFEPIVVDSGAPSLLLEERGSTPFNVALFDERISEFQRLNFLQSIRLEWPTTDLSTPKWRSPDGGNDIENSLIGRMKLARESTADALIDPDSDVVISLVPNHNDYRIIGNTRIVTEEAFVSHPRFRSGVRMAHSLIEGNRPLPGGSQPKGPVLDARYAASVQPDFPLAANDDRYAIDIDLRAERLRSPFDPDITGDFNTGTGMKPDGAYVERPDGIDVGGLSEGRLPYFEGDFNSRRFSAAAFSPYLQVPSAVTFGSIQSGVQDRVPWQTLLFRPADRQVHYGMASIPDYFLLDYFRMPVIRGVDDQPPHYDKEKMISGRFFTEGKVNLNYRMVPFHYIRRASALHALFKAEKLLAIPTDAADRYKSQINEDRWRHFIDAEETLKQWDETFASGELFRHGSEICEMYLVPEGETWRNRGAMEEFWERHRLTGDNVKERPYASLAPRVTTLSNSYQLHMIAQEIRMSPESDPGIFDPNLDTIVSSFRGTARVERFIDNDDIAGIGDIADGINLLRFYQIEASTPVDYEPPAVNTMRPRIVAIEFTFDSKSLVLRWTSCPNAVYRVDESLDLVTWRTGVLRNVPSGGSETAVTIPISSLSRESGGYLRVVKED